MTSNFRLKMKNWLGEDDTLDTAFLVERGFGGIEVSEPRRLAGLKGLDLVDVTFKDVKVPLDNVLGAEGQGLQVSDKIGFVKRGQKEIVNKLFKS